MNATAILAGALVVVFGLLGAAKLAAVPAMRVRAEHVGMTVDAYRLLGGAVAVHLRNGDGVPDLAPAVVVGLLSVTFLVLAVGHLR